MLLSDCISSLITDGERMTPVAPRTVGKLSRVTVTVTEGRFVFLPGESAKGPQRPAKPGCFVFHRLNRDGSYVTEVSKPPGRLTWRRKAAFAKKQMRGGK